jgi:beta-xylosidase
MPNLILHALLILLPWPVAQQATYVNPVFPRDFPDPHVIAVDGRFYAFATQTRGTGFQLLTSADLVDWTPLPLEFPVPWSREHLWAPEVVEYRGTYYMTYSALDPRTKKHNIGIATAEEVTGPYTHRGILVRGDGNRIGVIDATIVVDGDRAFLVYSEEEPRRIVMRRLRDDLLAVEPGDPVELIRPDLSWERGVTEAPTIYKRDGKYHLFYSGCGFQGRKADPYHYAVGHAVADRLEGPYVKSPEPILRTVPGRVYGPGHQSLVRDSDGRDWLLYHGWDDQKEPRYGSNPLGRTMRLDPILWDKEGQPRVEGPSLEPRPAPRIAAPARQP